MKSFDFRYNLCYSFQASPGGWWLKNVVVTVGLDGIKLFYSVNRKCRNLLPLNGVFVMFSTEFESVTICLKRRESYEETDVL